LIAVSFRGPNEEKSQEWTLSFDDATEIDALLTDRRNQTVEWSVRMDLVGPMADDMKLGGTKKRNGNLLARSSVGDETVVFVSDAVGEYSKQCSALIVTEQLRQNVGVVGAQ
jgi:hypothetical protein